ncbi:MAG: NblA/ycf18 family protein [Desertifilum sp.]|nr:NblA/ycf18 family protein [Desertifilum sp.]
MSNPQTQLTLEQQFLIRAFKAQVAMMSREQAQEMLVSLYEQMMVKDATYRRLIAHEWGISKPDVA